jgi:hypothetical protein
MTFKIKFNSWIILKKFNKSENLLKSMILKNKSSWIEYRIFTKKKWLNKKNLNKKMKVKLTFWLIAKFWNNQTHLLLITGIISCLLKVRNLQILTKREKSKLCNCLATTTSTNKRTFNRLKKIKEWFKATKYRI